MLAGELLPRSCPCPHAARSHRARLQMPGLGIARRVPGLAAPASGRGVLAGVSLPTAHAARLEPGPSMLGQQPGLRRRSLERPRGVLRVKLDGEASRVCLRPAHAGPQRQRGGSGLQGFSEGDRDPAARTLPNSREARSPRGWGLHSRSAECGSRSPCDRPSWDAASFLPCLPGVWGVCVAAGIW